MRTRTKSLCRSLSELALSAALGAMCACALNAQSALCDTDDPASQLEDSIQSDDIPAPPVRSRRPPARPSTPSSTLPWETSAPAPISPSQASPQSSALPWVPTSAPTFTHPNPKAPASILPAEQTAPAPSYIPPAQPTAPAPASILPAQQTAPSAYTPFPARPRTMPPDVGARPSLPAPPAVALPAALGSGDPKASLAWRAKAFRLSNLDSKSSLIKSEKLFEASVSDTASALQKAGKSQGIDINAQFQGSGQLLGKLTDGSSDRVNLVFSLDSVGKKSTLVRAGVEPETNAIKRQLFDDLLNQTAELLRQKELL